MRIRRISKQENRRGNLISSVLTLVSLLEPKAQGLSTTRRSIGVLRELGARLLCEQRFAQLMASSGSGEDQGRGAIFSGLAEGPVPRFCWFQGETERKQTHLV